MIIFDDGIDRDSVIEFIESIDTKVSQLEENELLEIYFTSNGGHMAFLYPLKNAILKNKDKIKFCLIDEMSSSGFDLLWYLKDMPIYMYPSFRFAMFHKASNVLSTSSPVFSIELNELERDTLLWSQRLRDLGISEDKIIRFVTGENTFISKEELLKIFPNIIEIE